MFNFYKTLKNVKIYILIFNPLMMEIIKKLKITKNRLIWFLFYLLIFFILLNNSYNYLDPDLGWHLDSGKDIFENKTIPWVEHHDFTILGKTWVDHEWLMNLFIFLLYAKFGYLAVNIVFSLIVIIALIILNKLIYKFFNGPNAFFLMALQFFGILGMLPHLGVRVQEIALLNLVLLLYVLYHFNRNKNYKILLFLPPLIYFWSLVHASFLIGLAVLFFWLGVKIIESVVKKHEKSLFCLDFYQALNVKNFFICAIIFISSFLVTSFTPYRLALYDFLKTYSDTFYLTHIAEWFPVYYLPLELWKILYYGVFVSAFSILFWLSLRRKGVGDKNGGNQPYQINLWPWLLSIIFLFLSLKSRRHFPLFVIISLPPLVSFANSYVHLQPGFWREKLGKYYKFAYFYLIAALFIIISSRLVNTKFTDSPFSSSCSQFPCQAVEFLKNSQTYDNLKLLNSYSWGGYLIWQWQDRQLFIDGRLPQYPFAGRTMLEEYKIFFEKGKQELMLKKYDIGLVLLENTVPVKLSWAEKYWLGADENKINERENYLIKYLDNSPGWRKIYSDSLSLIYLKNNF